MAKAPARNHRDKGTTGGQGGAEQQRHAIADAAGGVLVEHRAGQIPGQNLARIAHRPGQRDPLSLGQATQTDRHGKGTALGIRDRARGQAIGKPNHFIGPEHPPRPDCGNDAPRIHSGPGPGAFHLAGIKYPGQQLCHRHHHRQAVSGTHRHRHIA